jgi:pimeloyl-ACP methyl ester carboxylesterase
MVDVEQVTVTLQSGVDVRVHSFGTGSDNAQPIVIVEPESSAEDWMEFAALLKPSHSPIFAEVSSALELMLLVWEIGEPVSLLSQGDQAAEWVSAVVNMAPGAVASLIVCDGEIPADRIAEMHAVTTLILRGRQGELLNHEDAVRLHESLRHSTLMEPENCGDFPAKANPDAAASAVNLFLSGSDEDDVFSAGEPIDPKS